MQSIDLWHSLDMKTFNTSDLLQSLFWALQWAAEVGQFTSKRTFVVFRIIFISFLGRLWEISGLLLPFLVFFWLLNRNLIPDVFTLLKHTVTGFCIQLISWFFYSWDFNTLFCLMHDTCMLWQLDFFWGGGT